MARIVLLNSKVVLITGASSGIGKATAVAFAKQGARLMLVARRSELLEDLATQLRLQGCACETFQADIQDQQAVQKLVAKTIQCFGAIDILINNAGVATFADFHSQKWTDIESTLDTNLKASMYLCHSFIPLMLKAQSGFILNVSSVLSRRGVRGLAAYSASKFGIAGFSESLRLELQDYGIGVCHFCPGATTTSFHEQAGLKILNRFVKFETADAVALQIVKAVQFRKNEVIISNKEKLLIIFHQVFPNLTKLILNLIRGV